MSSFDLGENHFSNLKVTRNKTDTLIHFQRGYKSLQIQLVWVNVISHSILAMIVLGSNNKQDCHHSLLFTLLFQGQSLSGLDILESPHL